MGNGAWKPASEGRHSIVVSPLPAGVQMAFVSGLVVLVFVFQVGSQWPEMARSRSFCLAMLATGHLLDGDIEHSAEIGSQAIITAETLKSVRPKDRLRPLKREADKRRDNPAARALAADIATFVAHPTHT